MINVELKPLLSRLNECCTRALEASAGLCVNKGSYEINIEHMLLKLLDDGANDFNHILQYYDIDSNRLQRALQQAIEGEDIGNVRRPVFSSLLIEWFQEAWLLSSIEFGLNDIRSGSLLSALILNPRRYGLDGYFSEFDPINLDELRGSFLSIIADSSEATAVMSSEATSTGEGPLETAPVEGGALSKYTVHFTQKARDGEIDPVFCRDNEIHQIVDVLSRRRKNNPILVGEAGVGKTAVVEGLALKIVENDVPSVLSGVEIYGLDMGLLQAGASVKGEFEQRLKSVISEVKSSPTPIILFIDEAHTLIGAGGAAGGNDAANLLKPALARGEMKTMAATTWSEYKKYFEKDPALARRFQLIKIEEPSPESAITIMRGLRCRYEESHGVYIRDDAVEASANLAARYITGRQLPDKSVDLLDTACARVKINLSSKPNPIDAKEREIKTLERELSAIQRDLDSGCRTEDDIPQQLKEKIKAIHAEVEVLNARWSKELIIAKQIIEFRALLIAANQAEPASGDDADSPKNVVEIKQDLAVAEALLRETQGDEPLIYHEVGPEVVSQVVSDWTGIPVGNVLKDEAQSILSFANDLGRRIKGQDHAIAAIDRKIRAAKTGLSSPNAPIAVMLFVGPSGVGKTEATLGIADLLLGDDRFTVSINMSEFQEKHSVSRLVGSPPGYVGYGEGGLLTEAVRQRPYSVVLLDECEKADLEVMNLFYQVFDKGSLTDGEGREIDFKNTVVILTSNLATDIIANAFADGQQPSLDELTEAIRPVLSNHFKPALLARMEIVPFYPLAREAMKDIVKIKLKQVGKRLELSHKMKFHCDDAVVESIVSRCNEVETGARNIDHIVNKTLLPQISTEILQMMAQEEMPAALNVGIDPDGGFSYTFSN